MKKTLSILLSLCMLLSITVCIDFNSFAATLYEYEDNNSYSNANFVPLNSSISGAINYGTFENNSDIDYYKIVTTQDGTLSIKFSHEVQLNSVASWNINVYVIDNFDMCLLTSFTAEAKKNSVNLPKLGLEAGTYYISITNRQYTCDMEYIITNTFSATSTWETEFNNSYSTADELKINQYIEGCIGEGSFSNSDNADYDYYKINIPNSGKLRISVYSTSENIDEYVFWNIEIYKFSNGSYNQLANERVDANNTPYSFPTFSVTSGVYYVVVKNSQYAKCVNYKILNTFECNHSYETTVLTNPNCTASGEKRSVCKYCGNAYTETISPLGHTYDNGVVIKTANCSENGIKKYTCIICGNTKNETISATGHSFSSGAQYCDNGCGTENPNYIDEPLCNITGHYYKTTYIEPTCTSEGYTLRTCQYCGQTLKEIRDKLQHNWDNGRITKYATYTSTGVKTYTCVMCGETADEVLSATEHSYATTLIYPTCLENGYTKYLCVNCGYSYNSDYVFADGHDYKSVITTPATCTSTGIKTYTCNNCGDTYTETIAKIAHTYKTVTAKADTSKNGSVVTKCTVCGTVSKTTAINAIKSVSLAKTSYVYDGKTKNPTVTVKDSKGKKIDAKYYTVKYSSNKNVGKATVTVTFKGNYSGIVKKTFTIKPKATSISSLKAGKKKFTVKWKKQATQTTGYQIQYSTDKNFKKNNKTVTIKKNKTTSKSISKLKAKKKYYVRIRTYKTVNGTKIYSDWSKTKSATTKK